MKNVFYFYYINEIGGVETFFWNLVQKYGDTHDIVILYRYGAQHQIDRLRTKVSVRKWNGRDHIQCDKLFVNYSTNIIDFCDFNECIQIIHADYLAQKLKIDLHPDVSRYVAVSKLARESFKTATGLEPELCYNPLVDVKPKKVLRLVSATRLTPEKGKNRIKKLADAMSKAGIQFEWTVFTTSDQKSIEHDDVVIRSPKLNVIDYIAQADYLVQLSDCEAYCYTVVEALSVGTPVIVTDLPVYYELGLNEVNSIRLGLNMKDLPLEKIKKGLPRVEDYYPPEDRWDELLLAGPSEYDKQLKVVARCKFRDLEEHVNREKGDMWECSVARADKLEELGLVRRKS